MDNEILNCIEAANEGKLLPCPFCGNEVEYHPATHHMNNFWNKNTIYCPTCDFMMESAAGASFLFKKWNKRVPAESLINKLLDGCFSAEVYNDDFDGTTIDNLLCLGDVRDALLEKGLLDE